MTKLILKKAMSNKSEVLKRGEDARQLEKFRKLILDHLSTLDDGEPEAARKAAPEAIQKAFSSMIRMEKGGRGLAVGTVREWKGRKFKKTAPGKWRPVYDGETRGAKMAVSAIKRKIAAAPDAQTMMRIILENRYRFSDKNGQPLPFVMELHEYIMSTQDSREKAEQQVKNTPQESKDVQPKDEKGKGQEKTPEGKKQAGARQGAVSGISPEQQKEAEKKLEDLAVPMMEVEYSNDEYNRLFPEGTVKTPIKTVKMGADQFAKLGRKDNGGRQSYIGAAYQTLTDPVVIIKEGNDDVYIKSFAEKDGIATFISVEKDKDDGRFVVTSYKRKKSEVIKKIKRADSVAYLKDDRGSPARMGKEGVPHADSSHTSTLSPDSGEKSSEKSAESGKTEEGHKRKEWVNPLEGYTLTWPTVGGTKPITGHTIAATAVNLWNHRDDGFLTQEKSERRKETYKKIGWPGDASEKLEEYFLSLTPKEVKKAKAYLDSLHSKNKSDTKEPEEAETDNRKKVAELKERYGVEFKDNIVERMSKIDEKARPKAKEAYLKLLESAAKTDETGIQKIRENIEDVLKKGEKLLRQVNNGAKLATGPILDTMYAMEAASTAKRVLEGISEAAKREPAENGETNEKSDFEKIQEKYQNAAFAEGDDDEIQVGKELISGKWKLVEADTPTASHDETSFHKTPGFPATEDGSTINDRDYGHDKEAQEIVMEIGSDYDGRAVSVDNPVVVTKDGIVISGNNRTMSSKIAARKGTDKGYIETLKRKAKKFGFTPERIDQFKHPRVIFETAENNGYSTDQFAKFNKSSKKAMSPIESAVKVSKTIKVDTVESIAGKMADFETLGELYADRVAVNEIFNTLQRDNIITSMDRPQYVVDGGITGAGKEFLETVLIGSVINESNIRGLNREGCKSIRRKLVRAITPLIENKGMDGYSVSKELNSAVDIAMQVAVDRKHFKDVDDFSRQKKLFEADDSAVEIEIAKRLEGTEKHFAEFMQAMNGGLKYAANGEADIFLGGVESREDILARMLNLKKAIGNVIDFFRNLREGKGPRFIKKAVPVRGADGAAELSERWARETAGTLNAGNTGLFNTGQKTIAVDFDGVINSFGGGWRGPTETDAPVEGAAAAINTLIADGNKVVVYSTRAATPEGRETILRYLAGIDITVNDIEVTDKKPVADMYIDDRAVPFSGDWSETLKQIGDFKPWTEKSLTWSGYPLQGRSKVHGMDISIENKKGSVRSGTDKDGHDWSIKMNFDYGYIRGTVGKDKDHVDCVAPDTKILMGDYTEKPAKEIKAGDMVVASQENPERKFGQRKQMPSRVVWTETGRRKMFKFVLADGREIKTTAGHLHYIFRGKSRDKIWIRADELKTGHELVSIYNPTNMVENEEYKKGYLYGAYKGDGSLNHDGAQVYCDIAKGIYGYPVIERIKLFWSDLGLETASIHIEEPRNTAAEIDPGRIINSVMRIAKLSIRGSKKVHFAKQILTMESLGSADWCRGYLAGFFDTDGCLNVNKEAQICQIKDQVLAFSTISKAMDFIGFKSKVRGNSIFLSGDWNADNVALQFTQTLKPALFKKRNFTGQALRYERVKIIDIEEYEGEFVAIQTEIGTYIANGLFTHNCYIGPNPESETAFVVHQNDPATGAYDEDKVMLGFDSEDEARKAYLSQYDRPGFLGDIVKMDIDTFKEKAFDPKNKGKKLAG